MHWPHVPGAASQEVRRQEALEQLEGENVHSAQGVAANHGCSRAGDGAGTNCCVCGEGRTWPNFRLHTLTAVTRGRDGVASVRGHRDAEKPALMTREDAEQGSTRGCQRLVMRHSIGGYRDPQLFGKQAHHGDSLI